MSWVRWSGTFRVVRLRGGDGVIVSWESNASATRSSNGTITTKKVNEIIAMKKGSRCTAMREG